MATQIYLGLPPPNVVKWIKDEAERKQQEMLKTPLTFTAEEAGAKLSLQSMGGPTVTLETSPTGEEGSWTPYTVGTEITLANVGDKVMFRNSSDTIQVMSTSANFNFFQIGYGKISASGNIMFLMDKTGELRDLSGKAACYSNMFHGCTTLTQAPALPATTLAGGCYQGMFQNCTTLTQAPALPATTLVNRCYWFMFDGCSNIPEPKYNMSHMTFDEVANAIQNNQIFGDATGTHEVQCSDKILVATYDDMNWQWTITEK